MANIIVKVLTSLLYIDTVASLYGRSSLAPSFLNAQEYLRSNYWWSSFDRDAQKLLSAGADKIAVNSAAVRNQYSLNLFVVLALSALSPLFKLDILKLKMIGALINS